MAMLREETSCHNMVALLGDFSVRHCRGKHHAAKWQHYWVRCHWLMLQVKILHHETATVQGETLLANGAARDVVP